MCVNTILRSLRSLLQATLNLQDAAHGDGVIGSLSIQVLALVANTPEGVVSMPLLLPSRGRVAAEANVLLEFEACFIPVRCP